MKLNIQWTHENSKPIVFYSINPFRKKKSMKLGLQQLFSPPRKLLHFPTEVSGNSLTEGLIIIITIYAVGVPRIPSVILVLLEQKTTQQKTWTKNYRKTSDQWPVWANLLVVVPLSQGMISSAKLWVEFSQRLLILTGGFHYFYNKP